MRLLPLALLLTVAAPASAQTFGHLQTDKPAYRLGDTLWWRAHLRAGDPIPATAVVRLTSPQGATLVEKALTAADVRAGRLDGAFLMDREWDGGRFGLELDLDGARAHTLPRDVYDVERPQLDLTLRVLGELHEPGRDLVATLAAHDLHGRPIAGVRGRWQATFGALVLKSETVPTDADGRALVRVRVPAEAVDSGHLVVGVEVGPGAKAGRAAVAAPVRVSASVGAVDLFPEGGSRLEGHAQRLGVLVRDLDGRPTAAEGRVFDDREQVVGSFLADGRGLAVVQVPFEKERSYEVRIDRPAGVARRFPVPGPTLHGQAMSLDVVETHVRVTVRGEPLHADAFVIVHTNDASLGREEVKLRGDAAQAVCRFPLPAVATRVHAVLVIDGRPTLRRTAIVGSGAPVELKVEARAGLPGEEVVLGVLATRDRKPVKADLALSVFRGSLAGADPRTAHDLAARVALGPSAGAKGDLADLLLAREGEGAAALQARRDAFTLVHDAISLPPEGVAEPSTTTARRLGLAPPPIAPRPRPVVADAPTRARADGLERLMARAAFTRAARPSTPAARTFGPDVPAERLDDVWGLGRLAKSPPQESRPSGLDTRDTLCWVGRLVTDDQGRGTVRFRLSHEVEGLAVDAVGFAGGTPVATRGVVEPRAGFETRSAVPDHLAVGDLVDLYVALDVRDGGRDPVAVRVLAPPGLRPLDRTELTLRPDRDAARTKFRFEAIAPTDDASLTVVATRGQFREVTRSPLRISHPRVEVTHGRSGRGTGAQSILCSVPAGAVSGSTRVRAQVYPTPESQAVAGLEALLREPYGCMEQTTSTNYPNLVVLEALLGRDDADPAVLEKAYGLARRGHERVLTFRHASGGFALFPGQEPQVRYTCLALAQLAAFAQLFGGEGTAYMQQALDWLEQQKDVTGFEAIYAAFACAEAGVPWRGAAKALATKPRTACETALLANAVGLWRTVWPLPQERLHLHGELLDALTQAEDGSVTSQGTGVVFSSGGQLQVETTALAAVAFVIGGREDEARLALSFLEDARQPTGGWSGTHATVLAVRALSFLPPRPPADALSVRFAVGAGEAIARTMPPAGRPLTFERSVPSGGAPVEATLHLGADVPMGYSMAYSYQVSDAVSSPAAPYALETSLPAMLRHDEVTTLGVTLRRTSAVAPAGQVVARIALPGGCAIERAAGWEARVGLASRIEVEHGWVTLYFSQAPTGTVHLALPVRAVTPGNYRGAPSTAYPYYEDGRTAFAPGLDLKVIDAFDIEEAAATLRGR